MHGIIDIAPDRLALTALLLVLLVAISWRFGLRLERTLLVASARGTLQLIAVGYVLAAVFAVERVELVLAMLAIMLGVAARTSIGRLSTPLPGLSWFAAGSLAAGTGLSLVFMARAVVGVTPWYDPQYLIPFGGMLLGNSMNGTALAGERFQEELRARKDQVEARLALGFSGAESVQPLLARSLRASMIPTVNSFMVAGIVQLPGMMTGQVLSGTDPLVAVKYQVLIFFLLMTSTAVSALSFLRLMRARYLTPAHQLRRELLG